MKWSWKDFHSHWKLLKSFRSQKTTEFEQNLPSCWFCGRNKEIWINMFSLTLNSLSSFPASARSKVVFPELGGPSSNVNLQFHSNEFQQQPRHHQSAISLLPPKKDRQQIKLEKKTVHNTEEKKNFIFRFESNTQSKIQHQIDSKREDTTPDHGNKEEEED